MFFGSSESLRLRDVGIGVYLGFTVCGFGVRSGILGSTSTVDGCRVQDVAFRACSLEFSVRFRRGRGCQTQQLVGRLGDGLDLPGHLELRSE